jgi:glucosamine-6-phosphate deaminase
VTGVHARPVFVTQVRIFDDKKTMGAAAELAAAVIGQAIAERGQARIIAAAGAAHFEFLEALTSLPGIDWPRVELFHLDEYVGVPITHPASFRRYLLERLIWKTGIRRYHLLDGEGDPEEVCREAGEELNAAPVAVAFVGIGENGHLAFNDPPADFESERPYLVVRLDEACRRQQVGEGWFASLAEVPERAISMSVRQILKARQIVCVVPDARKAAAVKACLEGEIGPMAPASILRTHPNVAVFLDRHSAAQLGPRSQVQGSIS